MTAHPVTRPPGRVSIRWLLELGDLVRADAGHRRLDEMPRATSVTRSSVVSSSRRDRRSGSMSSPNTTVCVGRVAGDRVGVLERQHAPAGGVGAGALELLLRAARSRAGRRRSRACSGRPRRTCRTPARPTAAGSARRRTCGRPSRPSRRARAARGSRRTGASPSSRPAASSRRQRGALLAVARVDLRAVGDAQVRLVGLALLDERLRRERRRRLEAAVRRDRREAPERLRQLARRRARARGCRPGTRRRASPPTGARGRRRSRRA